MTIGIIYYSRTGNTRHAAKLLEEKLKERNRDVKLVEIEAVKKPGFFKAGFAAFRQKELPMKPPWKNQKQSRPWLLNPGLPTR